MLFVWYWEGLSDEPIKLWHQEATKTLFHAKKMLNKHIIFASIASIEVTPFFRVCPAPLYMVSSNLISLKLADWSVVTCSLQFVFLSGLGIVAHSSVRKPRPKLNNYMTLYNRVPCLL